MSLAIAKGARILVSTDGKNCVHVDTGRECIPLVTEQEAEEIREALSQQSDNKVN